MDLGVVHDAHHGFQFALGDVEYPAHVIFHVVARNSMFRHRGGSRDDRRMGRICLVRRRERGYAVSTQSCPLSPGRNSRPYTPTRAKDVKNPATTSLPDSGPRLYII